MNERIIINSQQALITKETNLKSILRRAFQFADSELDKKHYDREFSPKMFLEVFAFAIVSNLFDSLDFTTQQIRDYFLLKIQLTLNSTIEFIQDQIKQYGILIDEPNTFQEIMIKAEEYFINEGYNQFKNSFLNYT